MMKARISEIFLSIQGEGVYVGEEQIFIRFYGCNLNGCRFCDTQLYSFREYNSLELSEYLTTRFNDVYSISLTGGEPLVQKDFLKEFLPSIKRNFKIYLETNATLPTALEEIIDYIDVIAMDFKLPSSTGLGNFWLKHKEFLRIALQREVFVKVVICKDTELIDVKKAIELLSDYKYNITFILQPNSFEIDRSLMVKIQDFQKYSLGFISDVRLIPQMHKLVGIR